MVDKPFCMSSYLTYRYIEKNDVDFYLAMHHKNIAPVPEGERIDIRTSADIDWAIQKQFLELAGKKIGIMLSGGMDSAILAAYMQGNHAYTFRFLNGEFQKEELQRAEYYARRSGLKLHYVDIDWHTVEKHLQAVMQAKSAPVHSIEPQILQAALQAQIDGIDIMVVGAMSDLTFGGMDQLLSQDWDFDAFVKRYTYTRPIDVLAEPVDVNYLFERYRKDNKIDFQSFLKNVSSIECLDAYENAFQAAGLSYFDPYSRMQMSEPLDLCRIRHGESKYLIRELFSVKYAGFPVPEKTPMPRPVDTYFENWEGPKRPEFIQSLQMNAFSGNQKWQMWCLEKFLDMFEAV